MYNNVHVRIANSNHCNVSNNSCWINYPGTHMIYFFRLLSAVKDSNMKCHFCLPLAWSFILRDPRFLCGMRFQVSQANHRHFLDIYLRASGNINSKPKHRYAQKVVKGICSTRSNRWASKDIDLSVR